MRIVAIVEAVVVVDFDESPTADELELELAAELRSGAGRLTRVVTTHTVEQGWREPWTPATTATAASGVDVLAATARFLRQFRPGRP